ncbi:MAG: acyl-CoA dehydrogenase family protein [Deltaproteobacteria bacterium]|nr:acyl-CoA dehydrogenase family protein [Deltaproteobacteria bacterium]
MQFKPSDDDRMLLEAVRALADGALRDSAEKSDRDGVPAPKILKHLVELGAFGLQAHDKLGGLALGQVATVATLQVLAAADAGLAQVLVHHGAALAVLQSAGFDGKMLAKLAGGQALACLGGGDLSVHPDAVQSPIQASESANGWRLSGRHGWLLGAGLAHLAVLQAETAQGPRYFAVDLSQPGSLRRAAGEQLGLRSAAAQSLELSDCPATLLGDVDARALATRLQVQTAAVAVGVAQAALRAACKYANQREQFGKPIAALQPIQWQVADAATAIDAAQLLVQQAAWQLDDGHKQAGQSARMALVKAREAAVSASDKAIQIHGGYGYTKDFPVERAYRDAMLLGVLHGSSAAHKVALVRAMVA